MPDTWGGIQVPDNPPAQVDRDAVGASHGVGTAAGDPCLTVILQFLRAFLVYDGNAVQTWNAVYPYANQRPVITTMWAHDPSEVVFQTEFLPALFMWRDSARQDWIADDWMRETTRVKALWAFPLALQDNQRIRSPFINVLVKAMTVGIERGRTPSYVIPGDPDPNAKTLGSVYWQAAGYESFNLKTWKRAKLALEGIAGERDLYPAIEFAFDLEENLVSGLDRFALLDNGTGADLSIKRETGATVVEGPI